MPLHTVQAESMSSHNTVGSMWHVACRNVACSMRTITTVGLFLHSLLGRIGVGWPDCGVIGRNGRQLVFDGGNCNEAWIYIRVEHKYGKSIVQKSFPTPLSYDPVRPSCSDQVTFQPVL